MSNTKIAQIAERACAKATAARKAAERAAMLRLKPTKPKPHQKAAVPSRLPPGIKQLDTIQIRPEHHNKLLADLIITNRLKNVLQHPGFKTLGDLHGMHYTDFAHMRGSGPHSLIELRELVRPFECKRIVIPPPCFSVPLGGLELKLDGLPLSRRIAGILTRCGFKRLGDLDGLPISKLMAVKQSGIATITQLQEIIQLVRNGKLAPGTDEFTAADTRQLLLNLDNGIAKLPIRHQEILLLHLGRPANQRHPNLRETGERFGLTRQPVVRIMANTLSQIPKLGGPVLFCKIRGLKAYCQCFRSTITDIHLSQWLKGDTQGLRYGLEFYVRLINQLIPTV